MARAVDQDKSVQAYLKGRKQLVLFDDVDVGLPVERKMGETKIPMAYVLRSANHKTFLEINDEIRRVQAEPVPPNKGTAGWLLFLMTLPGPLPRLFTALLLFAKRRDPARLMVSNAGTVGVTAVGMFGHGHGMGWGITPPAHSVGLIVGGIARKPWVVDGQIEPRRSCT